jgi:hypothetical protein
MIRISCAVPPPRSDARFAGLNLYVALLNKETNP